MKAKSPKMLILAISALAILVMYNPVNAATKLGQEMFDKLKTMSGVPKDVKIEVSREDGSYASTNSKLEGIVRIAHRDIKLCKRNKDCIGFIVAHELGHHKLGHILGVGSHDSQMREWAADIYAVRLTHRAGLDCYAGAKFFTNLGQMLAKQEGGDSHPDFDLRATYITKECNKLKGK